MLGAVFPVLDFDLPSSYISFELSWKKTKKQNISSQLDWAPWLLVLILFIVVDILVGYIMADTISLFSSVP
jgi:cell division protein FtsX